MPSPSETHETTNLDILDFIKNYWIVLVFLVTVVMTWATFQSRVNALESEVGALQTQNQEIATHLASIDVSVAQINTTLKYLSQTSTPK